MLLEVRDLTVHYGRIQALHGVSLDVQAGEIVALIGANGAGKTTLLKTVAGLLQPSTGTVRYDGQPLDHLAAHARVQRGLVLVPEGRGILARMTVFENLLMGAYARRDGADPAGQAARLLKRFPLLAERRQALAAVLSGGEQQLLALARALMARPRLLLVDEPSLGLAPRVTREIFALVRELRQEGVTILLVEQNARQALEIADRGYVLQTGRLVLSGTAAELLGNAQVQEAYLGARR